MQVKYSPGDRAYIVENGRIIKPVAVIRASGGFVTLAYADRYGGLRLRENQLFPTRKAAEESLSQKG